MCQRDFPPTLLLNFIFVNANQLRDDLSQWLAVVYALLKYLAIPDAYITS
jgi:hypothetical protein